MVAADETLQAGSGARVAEVLTELDGLINGAVAVAQVGRERVSEVDAEAFGGAGCWVGLSMRSIS